MLTDTDTWGLDPSVQAMRLIFTSMEKAQTELLKNLKMSPFDKRLRPAQESARKIFEKAWALSVKRGNEIGENEVSALYAHCLAQALLMAGVEIPDRILTGSNDLAMLIKEAIK